MGPKLFFNLPLNQYTIMNLLGKEQIPFIKKTLSVLLSISEEQLRPSFVGFCFK